MASIADSIGLSRSIGGERGQYVRTGKFVPQTDLSPLGDLLKIRAIEDQKLKMTLSGYKPDFTNLQKILEKQEFLPNDEKQIYGGVNQAIDKLNSGMKKYGGWVPYRNSQEFEGDMADVNVDPDVLSGARMAKEQYKAVFNQVMEKDAGGLYDVQSFLYGSMDSRGNIRRPFGSAPNTVENQLLQNAYSPDQALNPTRRMNFDLTDVYEARKETKDNFLSDVEVDKNGFVTGISPVNSNSPFSKATYEAFERMKVSTESNVRKLNKAMKYAVDEGNFGEYLSKNAIHGFTQGYLNSKYFNEEDAPEVKKAKWGKYIKDQLYDIIDNGMIDNRDVSASTVGVHDASGAKRANDEVVNQTTLTFNDTPGVTEPTTMNGPAVDIGGTLTPTTFEAKINDVSPEVESAIGVVGTTLADYWRPATNKYIYDANNFTKLEITPGSFNGIITRAKTVIVNVPYRDEKGDVIMTKNEKGQLVPKTRPMMKVTAIVPNETAKTTQVPLFVGGKVEHQSLARINKKEAFFGSGLDSGDSEDIENIIKRTCAGVSDAECKRLNRALSAMPKTNETVNMFDNNAVEMDFYIEAGDFSTIRNVSTDKSKYSVELQKDEDVKSDAASLKTNYGW